MKGPTGVKTILVVDDDDSTVELLAQLLELARDLHWAELIRKPLDLEALLRSVHRVLREGCERSALG